MQQNAGFIRSAGDYAYNSLRSGILNHTLPAGARLVESKVAKDLGVSITPVREAFDRLEAQGLIAVFPYRGTYVTTLTQESVDDVYYMRSHLEEMASELALPKTNEEDIARLQEFCRLSDAAFDEGNMVDMVSYDAEFHSYLIQKSGNELLKQMWELIRYRIEYISSFQKPIMKQKMAIRHQALLNAVQNKDASAFAQAIRQHLADNRKIVDFPKAEDIH